ncbi:hypothetical protein V5E97_39650 [Singulisphaera sp. Ch08]|uniref:DUF6896 domain-containing protein n=1 Tax=Singulisphaera sp. Ch08 TaxID=3120278 RepID=A0AAU7CGT3_9BACT
MLGPAFGVRLPATNREWVTICGECGRYKVSRIGGIGVYAHGFGIELVLYGVTMNFDWGDSGDPDGVDTWRLWNFVRVNRIAVDCRSFAQIQSWLEEAAAIGELTEDRHLYYSPTHRARPSAP